MPVITLLLITKNRSESCGFVLEGIIIVAQLLGNFARRVV